MNELQIFNYNDNQIRTVEKEDGLWWVLADVCGVLETKNITDTANRLEEDERGRFNLGRQGDAWIIKEAGLYSVILRSDKAEAKKFKRWVTHEVLPNIRKHGAYIVPETSSRTLTDTDRKRILDIKEMNARVRMSNQLLKLTKVDTLSKEYKNILVAQASRSAERRKAPSTPQIGAEGHERNRDWRTGRNYRPDGRDSLQPASPKNAGIWGMVPEQIPVFQQRG